MFSPTCHRRIGHALFLLGVGYAFSPSLAVCSSDPKEIQVAESPSWVRSPRIDLEQAERDASGTGSSYFVLVEMHCNFEERHKYMRYAVRMNSSSGVQENSQLSVTFDPTFETPFFHHIRIHREGEVLEVLPHQQFRIAQREESHERQMYDNRLTATAIVEGTRVGDIIDFAYSVRGSNSVHGDFYYWEAPTAFPIKVGRVIASCRFHKDSPVFFSDPDQMAEPIVLRENDDKIYCWDFRQPEMVVREPKMPLHHPRYGVISMTNAASWVEIQDWAHGLFPIPESLPPEIQQVCDSFQNIRKTEDVALAALHFVQDEIRYLGTFEGVHTHKPHTLEEINRRRYGDCKDKAILLTSMLHYLGIEACPALVSTQLRGAVARENYSLVAFDHVVVRIRIHGKDYWVDPTMTHQQGTLGELFFPDYGQALPLVERGSGLEPIAGNGIPTELHSKEKVTVLDFSGKASIAYSQDTSGEYSLLFRELFESQPLEAVEAIFLKQSSLRHPEIERVGSLTWEETDGRFLRITEEFEADLFLASDVDLADRFYGTAICVPITEYLEPEIARGRTHPLGIEHPVKASSSVEVVLPIPLDFEESSRTIETEFFLFRQEIRSTGTGFRLHCSYESRQGFVPVESLEEYADQVQMAQDLCGHLFYVDRGAGGLTQHSNQSGTVDREALVAALASPTQPTAQPAPSVAANPTEGATAHSLSQVQHQPPIQNQNVVSNVRPGSNGPLLLTISMIMGLVIAIGAALFRPKPRELHERNEKLTGLAGWLRLPALHLVAALFLSGYESFLLFRHDLNWIGHPVHWLVLVPIIFFPFLLVAVTRFFQQHYTLPLLMCAFYGLNLIIDGIALAFLQVLPPDLQNGFAMEWLPARFLLPLIWIGYFLRSTRVANTFRKGIPEKYEQPAPLFPAGTSSHAVPPHIPGATGNSFETQPPTIPQGKSWP
ncbi:MAG: DUF3857 domain-containing protein [Verrucomicrobiota bacterium]